MEWSIFIPRKPEADASALKQKERVALLSLLQALQPLVLYTVERFRAYTKSYFLKKISAYQSINNYLFFDSRITFFMFISVIIS